MVDSDKSTGLAAAWKAVGVPAATACHSKDHYTTVVKLKTRECSKKPLRSLQRRSRTVVNRSTVTLVGGDQRCESEMAALKRMLRRCNMLGRSSAKKRRAHVDGLCSRFLADEIGLEKRVGAVVAFQNFCSDTVSRKELWDRIPS